jgi:glycosyltransferase involved in cell wall biosynthesis
MLPSRNQSGTELDTDAVVSGPLRGLVALIPAFNEQGSIGAVVRSAIQYAEVIVVDDGSTDLTYSEAKASGAFVVRHEQNRGYDAALVTGFETAIAAGYSFAVTFDADGQHDPSLLCIFDSELRAGADIVVGCRLETQRWSESIFGIVGKFFWGVHDPLCGMKGYRLTAVSALKVLSTYKSIGTEILIRLKDANCKVVEVCFKARKRNGAPRFGVGIRANISIMVSLIYGLKFWFRENRR